MKIESGLEQVLILKQPIFSKKQVLYSSEIRKGMIFILVTCECPRIGNLCENCILKKNNLEKNKIQIVEGPFCENNNNKIRFFIDNGSDKCEYVMFLSDLCLESYKSGFWNPIRSYLEYP